MAIVGFTMEQAEAGDQLPPGCHVAKWVLTSGDAGVAIIAPNFPGKSVQVSGTFGVGGNLRIEGTQSPGTAVWATLNDPQGNALDITTAKTEEILENCYQIRPNCTVGDANTSLTVRLLMTTIARR